jgi:DNA polymerase III subunit alpha
MATLLYNNSSYNLLNSLNTPERLVANAKKLGYKAIGICDEGTMYGVVEFYDCCLKHGIKPIIGLSIKVEFDAPLHLLLFAKNDNGYLNLLKLSSLAQLNNTIKFSELLKLQDNLWSILIFDHLPWLDWFQNNNSDQLVVQLQKVLGSLTNVVIGVYNNDQQYYRRFNNIITELANRFNLSTVAVHLALYPEQNDDQTHLVLQAIRQQVNINSQQVAKYTNRHLLSNEELVALYPLDSINMTDLIADNCNVTLDIPKASLPVYQHDSSVKSKALLRALCMAGLKKRLDGIINDQYLKRLNNELDVIIRMGYEDYFLIVYDFILFANRNNIPTGPGRGSAAGSLVAYCLGITHVDPLKFDLLFERFLNPERISLPDIDSDFADDGRDRVIEYIFNKFDQHRSAHIITFGSFRMKQALRDVAKVLGLNSYEIDRLVKSLPDDLNATLPEAYKNTPGFRHLITTDEQYAKVYQIALKIENLPRHLSTHAAGIVMSNDPLENYIPISKLGNVLVTQYPMNYLERFGLIKMDILGLRNLTIIDEVARSVGVQEQLRTLSLDDDKTFQLLNNNYTLGIFQLESSGMRNLLTKLKPRAFDDIVAILALFRPGPMDNINSYLSNRQNPQAIKYINQQVKNILASTYGIMIYQEQVMQIAQVSAGFSLAKADILRKAISKKKDNEIQALKTEFIVGCEDKGMSTDQAEELFSFIEKFANYGFNKSHSVAYAVIAYQCAYLKAHYPEQFYCALLNSVIGNDTKINEYVVEGRQQGVVFLPPSIQHSTKRFITTTQGILFPLTAIKGFGLVNINEYLIEREQNGLYLDFIDFIVRTHKKGQSTKNFELLIKSGALDSFKLSRNTMLNSLAVCMKYAQLVRSDIGQTSFNFDVLKKPELIVHKDQTTTNIQYEMELMGVYFGKHPVTAIIEQHQLTKINLKVLKENQSCNVVVMITKTKQHRTKNGDLMLFLQVEDANGTYDFVAMPQIYQQFQSRLTEGIIYLQVQKDKRGSYQIKNVLKY